MTAIRRLEDAIVAAIDEDIVATTQVLGGVYVALIVELVRRNGNAGDEAKEITVEGGMSGRKLTIGAADDNKG